MPGKYGHDNDDAQRIADWLVKAGISAVKYGGPDPNSEFGNTLVVWVDPSQWGYVADETTAYPPGWVYIKITVVVVEPDPETGESLGYFTDILRVALNSPNVGIDVHCIMARGVDESLYGNTLWPLSNCTYSVFSGWPIPSGS